MLVASLYVPLQYPSRPNHLAFGVPKIMAGDVSLREKVVGREPDLCLAITTTGKEGLEPARLVPVSSLVYAAQCCNWESLSTHPDRSAGNVTSSSTVAPSGDTSTAPLEAIDEESDNEDEDDDEEEEDEDDESDDEDEDDEEDDEDDDDDEDDESDTASTTSNVAGALATCPSLIHLPLMRISLPHPPSFPTLHCHLHLPTKSLFTAILDLPTGLTSPDDPAVIAILQRPTTAELMYKLEWMKGFWENVVALGVGDERTWTEMDEAWRAVVTELYRRTFGTRTLPQPRTATTTTTTTSAPTSTSAPAAAAPEPQPQPQVPESSESIESSA